MYLARRLAEAIAKAGSSAEGSLEFKNHVVQSYQKRFNEMNTPLGRLAMLLDPRYRSAVLSADAADVEQKLLYKEVRIVLCYIYLCLCVNDSSTQCIRTVRA
jgi:hypothetical protein